MYENYYDKLYPQGYYRCMPMKTYDYPLNHYTENLRVERIQSATDYPQNYYRNRNRYNIY